ncbi:MAG TPA: OmpA family protein [Candidatus Acidoferrum sp.]|nr:OmpA family protein [Candidatus Acidoferrum sp.]
MAKFCVHCGAPWDPNARFCVHCGKPPDDAAAPPSQASRVSPPPSVPAPAAVAPSAGQKPQIPVVPIIAVVVGLLIVVWAVSSIRRAIVHYESRKQVEAFEKAFEKRESSQTTSKPTTPSPAQITPTAAPSSQEVPTPQVALKPETVGQFEPPQPPGPGEVERTVNGPEADLLVRTGSINNLGFGWPQGFDPFSGESTPPHGFPWTPRPGAADGTDRIMVGSVVTQDDLNSHAHDGYSGSLSSCCAIPGPHDPPRKERIQTMPRPITLDVGALPAKIDAVVFQIFADDFQSPVWHSHFQVSLNGVRIPTFEDAINSLDQTGPIGKLITLRLLPEYWPLLQSGSVKLLIDDPTTHMPDGYSVDFVRILVNPHKFKYQVSLAATVVDAGTHKPIAGANVTASLVTSLTDAKGHCSLEGLPAGLVVASANADGYDTSSIPVDLVAGHTGKADFQLHRHAEDTASLERAIAQTGSAQIYGIHFDTGSAKLRPDSTPALEAVLGLINGRPGSRWSISGHTDNQGGADMNQKLSEARAASVVGWLGAHGVATDRLVPQGFGPTRPIADNSTANGRALNRRVEVAPAP